MASATFPFRFDPRFRLAGLLIGVWESTAVVRVTDGEFAVRFGPWQVTTGRENVAGAEVTGPYAWPKVIGPPRQSFADRGLTFASNAEQGVCVRFREPVPGLEPFGWLRHPALTVTVVDAPALAELLDLSARQPADVPLEQVVDAVHDDLNALSAAELRRRAQELGIKGATRRSKSELVELLEPTAEVSRRD